MTYWIIPHKEDCMKLEQLFTQSSDIIDWKSTSNANIKKGDNVFIYECNPIYQIRYLCNVIQDNISFEESIQQDSHFTENGKGEYIAGKNTNRFFRLKLLKVAPINTKSLCLNSIKKFGYDPTHRIKVKDDFLEYLINEFGTIL